MPRPSTSGGDCEPGASSRAGEGVDIGEAARSEGRVQVVVAVGGGERADDAMILPSEDDLASILPMSGGTRPSTTHWTRGVGGDFASSTARSAPTA